MFIRTAKRPIVKPERLVAVRFGPVLENAFGFGNLPSHKHHLRRAHTRLKPKETSSLAGNLSAVVDFGSEPIILWLSHGQPLQDEWGSHTAARILRPRTTR